MLVWLGRATAADGRYGTDLPLIKATAVVGHSPQYLAELLMESTRMYEYNKFSVGRTDEEVFQMGM